MPEATEPRLRGLPAFAGVGEEYLARLETRLRAKTCRRNEVVYRNGDPCDGIYLIASGAILLRTEVRGEPIDRVFDLGVGEIFGEEEAVKGEPRGLAARALGETRLWHLPLEPLRELLREHPFVETVLRALAVRRRSSRLRARLAPASRREPRIWVDTPVTVTVDGGERVGARLEDLSPGGACFSAVPGWTAGRQIVLSLGTPSRPNLLQAQATICWHEEGSAGIQFDAPGPDWKRRIEQALRELVRSVE